MISNVDPAVGQCGGVSVYPICCLVLPLFDTRICVQDEKEASAAPKVDNATGNLRRAVNDAFCVMPLHVATQCIQHNHAIMSGHVDHAINIFQASFVGKGVGFRGLSINELMLDLYSRHSIDSNHRFTSPVCIIAVTHWSNVHNTITIGWTGPDSVQSIVFPHFISWVHVHGVEHIIV